MARIARNFFQNSSHFTVYGGINVNMVEGNSYRYDADQGGLAGDAEGLDDEEFEIIDKPILSMQVLEDITASISSAPFLEPSLKILRCSLRVLAQLEAPESKELLTNLVTMAIRITATVDGHFSDGVCPLDRTVDGLEQCLENVKSCVEEECQWSWISRAIYSRGVAGRVAVLERMLEDVLATFQASLSSTRLAVIKKILIYHPALGSRKNIKSAPTGFISYEDVQTMKNLYRGSSFQVYSARHKNHVVVLKEFCGSRAKQHLQQVLNLSHGLMDPCFLKVKGISTPESSTQFIVFDNACSGSFELKIASALQEDQKQSIRVGFTIVGGISVEPLPNPSTNKKLLSILKTQQAGLAYLRCKGIPLDVLSAKSLEIYITDDNELKIGFAPAKTDVADPPDDAEEDRLWEIFNESCLNTFERANRLLYQEERVALTDESENQTVILDSSESDSSEQFIEESVPVAHSSKARRELSWKVVRQKTTTVELVAQHYQDYLNTSQLKPTGSFALRQLEARTRGLIPGQRHQCSGYKREQITFTTTITENAVISHSTPFLGEICYLCGEQVEQDIDQNPSTYATTANTTANTTKPPPADPFQAQAFFRDFVNNEKQKLNLKRQALIKRKTAELVKFSQSFKLNTPVPNNEKQQLNLKQQALIKRKTAELVKFSQSFKLNTPVPNNEKQQLNLKQQALIKRKTAELVKFSQSFKLNTPVPEGLFTINTTANTTKPPPPDPFQAQAFFRDFVNNEKQKLNLKRQALIKRKTAELVKFSQSFKLNTPVPEGLFTIRQKNG
ncbi:hypothetical protein D9758_016181 [Tetrapyrgos nigripes]|uniref:Uncharacterized protein n=1 Tax=Tetrapyrgos nigripes TaxID=182062 RepID=A0A8H5C4L8_9AGAR|nr:hypothetical protein D9758_016181 [Tetrapyrgos nigripes]